MNRIDTSGVMAFVSCIIGIITMFAVIDFCIGWIAPIKEEMEI